MSPQRKIGPPVVLWIACLLYVVVRGLILFTAFDDVCIPIYELPGVGMIPKIALDGWKGAPVQLYYDNCGGLISTGLFAIPFYALFGTTYLTLKLVPATLGFGVLLLLWRYLDRHWSRIAANVGALVFALGPPTLTKYSLLAKGNHFENLFFQLVVLTAFAAVQMRPERRLRLFAFGASCGFAIFTYFGSLAIVGLTSLLHLVLRGPLRTIRDIGYALPGVVVGLSPLIWISMDDGRPLRFILGLLGGGDKRPFDPASQFQSFATQILPNAGCFEDLGPAPGRIGEMVFLAAFLGAWLTLLPGVLRAILQSLRSWGRPRGDASIHENFHKLRHAPFVLYFPAMTAVVTFGGIQFSYYAPPVEIGGFRYLVPHFMYGAMVIGTAISVGITSDSGVRRAWAAVLGGLTLASVPFLMPIIDWSFSNTGAGKRYNGFWMPYYSGVALHRHKEEVKARPTHWDFDKVVATIDDFEPFERREIAFGIGYHVTMARDLSRKHPEPPTLETLIETFPEVDHESLARGMGSYLRKMLEMGKGRRKRFEQYLTNSIETEHPLLPQLIEGLSVPYGFPLTRTLAHQFSRTRANAGSIPAPLRSDWMRGRGLAIGRIAGRAQPADDTVLETELAKPPYRGPGAFWRGLGRGIATQARPNDALTILERWTPEEHRLEALFGLGAEMRAVSSRSFDPEAWLEAHLEGEAQRTAFRAGWKS